MDKYNGGADGGLPEEKRPPVKPRIVREPRQTPVREKRTAETGEEKVTRPASERNNSDAGANTGAPRPAQGSQNVQSTPRPAQGSQNVQNAPRPVERAHNVQSTPRPAERAQNMQSAPRPVGSTHYVQGAPHPAQVSQNMQRPPRPAQASQNAQGAPRPVGSVTQGAPEGGRRTPAGVEQKLRTTSKRKGKMSTIVGRVLLVIFTVIFVLIFAVVALCGTLVNGPSETVRDLLVLSAMQASATKWLPGLFLDDAVVDEIMAKSEEVNEEVIPMGTFTNKTPEKDDETSSPDDTAGSSGAETPEPPVDEWASAIDGMIYKTFVRSTFKAYMLIVKDPSRVYVGTSSNFKSNKIGARIFDIVKREDAIAGINAGEFADPNGRGTGNNPIGLTYSKGECVWDDGKKRTFIGFDNNGVLHAVESMTKSKADELGIRDAVSFQTGNVLITNDGESVKLYYSEGNLGMSQRTAIAQRADGAVILLVTDGRSGSSLGATKNDVIDLLVSEGAVVAGMLDGGSSTMMYYEDYYTKYNIDTAGLDEYQRQGLTNRYKAFTTPRHLPTFFLVSPEK